MRLGTVSIRRSAEKRGVVAVAGATYTDLAHAIHIHPTLAEGVNTAAGGIHREIGT